MSNVQPQEKVSVRQGLFLVIATILGLTQVMGYLLTAFALLVDDGFGTAFGWSLGFLGVTVLLTLATTLWKGKASWSGRAVWFIIAVVQLIVAMVSVNSFTEWMQTPIMLGLNCLSGMLFILTQVGTRYALRRWRRWGLLFKQVFTRPTRPVHSADEAGLIPPHS